MSYDQQLRKTLDEASAEELVPGFDLGEGWKDVSARLKPQRRHISLNSYWPYAAAIAAILLLLVRQKENTSFTLVAFRTATAGAQQQERQARHPDSLPSPGPVQLAANPHTRPVVLHAAPVDIPVPLPADTGEKVSVPESTVALKEALPVRHYADITPVLPAAEEQPIADGQKKGFWRSRIARRRIVPQAGTKEEAPIHGLIYALNKK